MMEVEANGVRPKGSEDEEFANDKIRIAKKTTTQ